MNAIEFTALCKSLGACQEGLDWIKGKSLREFWDTCERADWMLWLCGNMVDKPGWATRQELVLAVCLCAETALPIFENEYPNDNSPRKSIETARAWANGKATIQEVRDAYAAAYSAAYSAAAYAALAAYSAYAAAYSAYTAYSAAAYYSAYYYAIGIAAAAAHAASAFAAQLGIRLSAALKRMADMVRQNLKVPAEGDMP